MNIKDMIDKNRSLPYYVIRTKEDKKIIHSVKEGYFNLNDRFLIMKTKNCNGVYEVLVNREKRKFSGNSDDVKKLPIEEIKAEYQKTRKRLKPRKMFKDFPELYLIKELVECE